MVHFDREDFREKVVGQYHHNIHNYLCVFKLSMHLRRHVTAHTFCIHRDGVGMALLGKVWLVKDGQ